jgi:YVTN family beta-propeller protein
MEEEMSSAKCCCSGKRSGYLPVLIALLLCAGGCKKEQPVAPDPPEPSEPIVLVVNGLAETLSLIRLDDGEVENDVLVLGLWANHVVVDSGGDVAYVVNSGENNIQVINLSSLESIGTIDIGIGHNPFCMAVADTLGFVTNFLTNSVSVVNLKEHEVIRTISVGIAPEGILLEEDKVYVANTGYSYGSYAQGTISVIDIGSMQVEATINVFTNPQQIVGDTEGNLHVVCTGDYTGSAEGKIAVVDPDKGCVIDTVVLGGSPCRAVLIPNGTAYVIGYRGGLMSYKWTDRTVLHDAADPIICKDGFADIMYDTATATLHICDFEDDAVLSVSLATESITRTYEVGDGPVSIVLRR